MRGLKAREIMVGQVLHVSPELTLLELERQLAASRISGAPVVEHGKVVGIVSRSDIDRLLSDERTRAAAVATYYFDTDGPEDATPIRDPTTAALESLRTRVVRDIMTREVISVPPEESVVRIAELMRTRRIHRVLVIEDHQLCGLVSSLDIVSAVADAG